MTTESSETDTLSVEHMHIFRNQDWVDRKKFSELIGRKKQKRLTTVMNGVFAVKCKRASV